jgi:hypothetical protein
MKPLVIVGSALVFMLASACGGGESSSSPSSPSPPTGGTVTVSVSSDRTVHFSSGDPSASARVEPASPYISVGHVFDSVHGTRHAVTAASALKFDLPAQVNGRTVTKATLRLSTSDVRLDVAGRTGPTATMDIRLRANAFMSDWDPASFSWNDWASLGYQSAGEARAAAPSSLWPPVDFDVTTIVRNWASGAWKNYGLRLAADTYTDPGGDSYGITNFYGYRSVEFGPGASPPLLIIEYR